MAKISEIKIDASEGFFSDKQFEWLEINNFSVITGINGSGKTKLLEYIDSSNEYKKNHVIRYIDVDYRPPSQKHANEIAGQYRFSMQNIDGKYEGIDKRNNKTQDWTNNKETFKDNNVLKSLDYSIIDSIIQERKKFQNNDQESQEELTKRRAYKLTYNINDLLPEDIKQDKSWDRIDRILKEFGLSIRVDRANLNAGLEFLRFNSISSSEITLEMKDLSSGEKVAFALALWTWGNSKGQKTDVLIVDEFDAHLNPSIAEKFIYIIKEYFVDLGVQVIMTTHKPSTVAFADGAGADIKWMEDGVIDGDIMYDDIIKTLSNGLLDINQLAQDAQLLVNNKKKVVVFTEGKNDKKYIDMAIRLLQRENDFEDIYIFGCTSATTIPAFVRIPFGHQTSVALFDTDVKGKQCAERIRVDQELKGIIVIPISSEDDKEIENLFDSSLRGNRNKRTFAKFMERPENQTHENFAGFSSLLDTIFNQCSALSHAA
jgi:ABC-type uncharacterized transport system ATPase component